MIIGIYNSGIQKRGMTPEESFNNLVKTMNSKGIDAKQLKALIGMNKKQLVDFNPAFIGRVDSIYKSLEKQPLSTSQIKEIKTALSILYLRHLQQEKWEDDKNYISFDRLELGAEDYSERNIVELCINYLEQYKNLNVNDYRDEITQLLDELKRTQPSIDDLKQVAKKEGFQKVLVESPDRLTTVPTTYQNYSTDKPLKRGGVIRFAPTPNGPLHIGHGRGISILADYADKYDMEFLLRFDDTNQDDEKKNSDISQYGINSVYSHIKDDFEWIRGQEPDRIIYASDRANLNRYERYARQLIQEDLAYVCFIKDSEYIAGKGREENLQMLEEIINAGNNPNFDSAGLLLGMKPGLNNITKVFNMSDDQIKKSVQTWVRENIHSGKVNQQTLKGSMNTSDGTKMAGYQKVQNKRVAERGESQWFWPNLSLQSVIDDKEEGVTHIIRGQDYDYAKAERKYSKASGKEKETQGEILFTLRFQAILRVLLNAPPVASTGNWGQVEVKNSKYPTSTSKIKKLIIDGEVESFLDMKLPTIYGLRNDSGNWGSAFRFYWTRFDLPNDLDPAFDASLYANLNDEIQENFPSEQRFKRFNYQLTQDITKLQEKGLYLAEDY